MESERKGLVSDHVLTTCDVEVKPFNVRGVKILVPRTGHRENSTLTSCHKIYYPCEKWSNFDDTELYNYALGSGPESMPVRDPYVSIVR